ncbi:hypothetical protein LCGC14_2475200 [marine sediment metagenome]|uniref:N-acetylmuramoyl-L-alanine amidase n=1 Tax=marine sediment metagenome TaxID=412755 RepID=A0A0F9B9Z7_9ZZZZ
MARFQGATWIPSPNFGYPRGTHGQLALNTTRAGKSGEFWHSQQGRQSVSIGMFQDPALEVSAHFLIPKVGKPVQMVDSSDPAWHTGNYLANLHYHGFEFEGGPPGNLSEPLTPSQIAWGVDLTHWFRQIHGTPLVYVRKDTLWEHNEVRNTACPSGRIPWTKVIAGLEEDEMGMTDVEKTAFAALTGRVVDLEKLPVPRRFVIEGDGAQYLYLGGCFAWHIPNTVVLRESGLTEFKLETWKRGDPQLLGVTLLRIH